MTSARWRLAADDLPQRREDGLIRHLLPEEAGGGHSVALPLGRHLDCIETSYAPSRDLAILSRFEDPEPRLVLTLGLRGQSSFVDAAGAEVEFNEGYATITSFRATRGERQYAGNLPVRQFRFSMSRQWLDEYLGGSGLSLISEGGLKILSHRPMSPHSFMAARNLLLCQDGNGLGRMRLLGQALTVLAVELAPLLDGGGRGSGFSRRDQDMAQKARAILLGEMLQPPSVAELAIRVGTNPFKLKRLFHHFFNDTPYGLLLRFRMHKAYELLESSGYSVGVVANRVGYAHASNFTAAFTRYFGISPGKVAKQGSGSHLA